MNSIDPGSSPLSFNDANEKLRDRLYHESCERHFNGALLHCVEQMMLADTHHEAFDALYNNLREIIDIDAFAILGNASDTYLKRRSAFYKLLYANFDEMPVEVNKDMVRWFKKRRNVRDLAEVPLLSELTEAPFNYRSLTSVPFGSALADSGVIICLHREVDFFHQEEHALIRRLANYTEHALRSIRLAERTQVLASAIEGSQSGMMLIEPYESGGEIIYVNRAFEELTGFNIMNMQGMTFLSDRKTENPERSRIRSAFKEARPGRFVLRNPRLDGTRFANEIRLSRIEDEKGGLRYMLATHSDISAQLEEEASARLMQEKLRDLQRSESIGQLAAGVAHDFNNLLAVINGSAELIKSHPEDTQLCRKGADRIEAASSRAAKMINRFLDLGQIDDEMTTIDLGSLATESRDLLESVVSSEIQFVLDAGRDKLPVTCNQTEILRVMLNLIQNAQDAIGRGTGTISQMLSCQAGSRIDTSSIRVGEVNASRDYAVYSVTDTGSGMDAETQSQLFGSIFTTKGASGSGVGMIAVADVVKAHDGALRVTSAVGEGTTIDIMLPIAEQILRDSADTKSGQTRLDGTRFVLVDDDTDVSGVVADFLGRLGADVRVFSSAMLALDEIKADPFGFSALISDYSMPEMSGARLAEQVNEIAPHLPIVIISALSRKISDQRLKKPFIRAIFAKPVDLSKLSLTLEALVWEG